LVKKGGNSSIIAGSSLAAPKAQPRAGPGCAAGRLMVGHNKMYFVYILKSLKDGKYYVGLTSDVQKRLGNHNSGLNKSTKNRRPFKLIYSESLKRRSEAREREKFLKSYSGVEEKRKIILEHDQ